MTIQTTLKSYREEVENRHRLLSAGGSWTTPCQAKHERDAAARYVALMVGGEMRTLCRRHAGDDDVVSRLALGF